MAKTGERLKTCHACRCDYRRVHKANEWEDKYSEREIAKRTEFCISCRRDLTWWWFSFLPITAQEVARYFARGDLKRKIEAERNQTILAVEDPPVQLED